MWLVSKGDEKKLLIFGKKVLRPIYGPITENGEYRKKMNEKIFQLFQKSNIRSFYQKQTIMGRSLMEK